jgi:hypothetical protein
VKIYGPFHALNNPLVMANLALGALNQGAELYKNVEAQQGNEFLNQAMISGEPVTSMPGGPFRRLASKLTGGAVSPDVTPTTAQLAEELAGLRERSVENVKGLEGLAGARAKLGPGPFAEGGPFDASERMFGGTPGMFEGETLPEKQEQRKIEQQDITNERSSIPYKTELAGAEQQRKLDVINDPKNLMTSLSKRRNEEQAAADVRRASAGPIATATTAARDAQQQRDADNMPLTTLKNKTGTIYVDRNTLKDATDANTTAAQAAANPDLIQVPKGKAQEQIADTRAAINRLQALDPLIDKYFPDTSKMNGAAANVALLAQGARNFSGKASDKNLNRFYQAKLDTVEIIKRINGRFPNQRELDIPLLPEPGGFESKGSGIVGMLSHAVPTRADSREVAHDKIRQAIERLKGYTSEAINSDTVSPGVSSEDDSDIGSAIDSETGATP